MIYEKQNHKIILCLYVCLFSVAQLWIKRADNDDLTLFTMPKDPHYY